MDITPIEDVAEQAGVPAADVAAYQEIEQSIGTGLLPGAVWASEMGHDEPAPGVYPARPMTWLQYATARQTTA